MLSTGEVVVWHFNKLVWLTTLVFKFLNHDKIVLLFIAVIQVMDGEIILYNGFKIRELKWAVTIFQGIINCHRGTLLKTKN